jgi:phosphinothricin acetyltransferase
VLTGTASFETEAPDAEAMRLRMIASDGHYPWIVATTRPEDGGSVVAYAYATKFRERPAYRYVVETSVYVADAAQGEGVGRMLYQALMDTLLAQGFTQAIGAIALPNEASVALHEALGFRPAGVVREVGFKLGRWVDVGYWQRQLADASVPPVEPRSFSDFGLVRT